LDIPTPYNHFISLYHKCTSHDENGSSEDDSATPKLINRFTLSFHNLSTLTAIREESNAFRNLIANLNTKYPSFSDDLSRLEFSFQRVSIRFVIHILDSANFHGMDEEISKGNLNERFVPILRSSIEGLNSVEWPESLQGDAKSLLDDLKGLEAAVISKRGVEATLLGHKVHEAEHKFHEDVHEWLGHK